MLEIHPGRVALPDAPLQAVLITSANAIPAIPATLRRLLLLAVGDGTAAAARKAGFMQVESAGRDADALAALTAARCDPAAGRLLLASGAGQGMGLVASLRGRGFIVHRRVAYRAETLRELPAPANAALAERRIATALFFSAATAHAFVACMLRRPDDVASVEALAISAPTARALSPLPWRRIRVACQPNQDELVALLS